MSRGPQRPPTLRSVDADFPDPASASIEHVSHAVPVTRRGVITGPERALLDEALTRFSVPAARVATMPAGLFTVIDDRAYVTDAGREALRRGWYPA